MTVIPFSIIPSKSFRSYYQYCGAMGSYAVFHLAGLYPAPATKQFLLSSPFFPRVSFFNPLFDTKTTIRAKNFSPQAIYINVRPVLRTSFSRAGGR